jgi:hypothetical protein
MCVTEDTDRPVVSHALSRAGLPLTCGGSGRHEAPVIEEHWTDKANAILRQCALHTAPASGHAAGYHTAAPQGMSYAHLPTRYASVAVVSDVRSSHQRAQAKTQASAFATNLAAARACRPGFLISV